MGFIHYCYEEIFYLKFLINLAFSCMPVHLVHVFFCLFMFIDYYKLDPKHIIDVFLPIRIIIICLSLVAKIRQMFGTRGSQ